MTDLLESIPEEIRPKLIEFDNKLKSIERIIQKIDEKSIKDVHSELKPLEAAKFDW
jgi:hypothetical protein